MEPLLQTPAAQAALLAAAGALAYWLKDVPGLLVSWLKRFVISTLSIDSRDEFLFSALVEYMDAHPSLRQGTARVSKKICAPGRHRAPTCCPAKACTSAGSTAGWSGSGASRESDTLSVYIPNPFHGGDWMRARLGSRRPLSSVGLKAGQAEALLADLRRFYSAHERYADLGIPWWRGYLLFDPPGTGKTSLVTALASELLLNVCTLSLASPIVTDEKIHLLLAAVPQRSLLLIEDVDAFFRQRDAAHAQVKLSFSGFLNALDGVATQEGNVLCMTTNHAVC